MTGFTISPSETGDSEGFGPNAKNPFKGDWLREHRFLLRSFFGRTFRQGDFLSVKDIKMPEKDIKELSVQTPGTTYRFASQVSYSDLEITFYGTQYTYDDLLTFQDSVHSLGAGLASYDDYKKTVVIDVFWTPERNKDKAIQYTFKGAWPSRVTSSQLSYSSSEILSITVIVKYDFFEVTTPSSVMSNDTLSSAGS